MRDTSPQTAKRLPPKPGQRKVGRPPKKSAVLLGKLVALIERGRSRRSAALAVKISPKTLQRWLRYDLHVRELISAAEEKGRPLAAYAAWVRHPFRGLRPPRSKHSRRQHYRRPKFHIPQNYRRIHLLKRRLR
jgi:hypothetical protein